MIKCLPYLLGVLVVLIIIGGYYLFNIDSQPFAKPPKAPVPSGLVVIRELPPLMTLTGMEVAFEGKVELPQAIAGYATEINIVRFSAVGENASKSVIKLVWEDGSVEFIPAGAANIRLAPDRRAKQISIVGYCMNERRIFKDQPRKGRLTWEIRYAPSY